MQSMPARINDITGKRFGNLTALYVAGKSGRENVWRCECVCGGWSDVRLSNLKSGNTQTCGCVRRKRNA